MKIVIAYKVEMIEEPIAMMREVAQVVIPGDGSEATLLAEVRDADALVVGISPPVGRRLIESAARLKHIARMGVGVDTVDLKAATEHGVMVTNVPDATSDTVAEFTMTLLLSLARNIPRCDSAVGGPLGRRLELIHANTELVGKTHGIVGLGRIGSRVAVRCKAFGMRILYYKRNRDLDLERSLEGGISALRDPAQGVRQHQPAYPSDGGDQKPVGQAAVRGHEKDGPADQPVPGQGGE